MYQQVFDDLVANDLLDRRNSSKSAITAHTRVASERRISPSSSPDAVYCVGCRTVSRDNATLAALFGLSDGSFCVMSLLNFSKTQLFEAVAHEEPPVTAARAHRGRDSRRHAAPPPSRQPEPSPFKSATGFDVGPSLASSDTQCVCFAGGGAVFALRANLSDASRVRHITAAQLHRVCALPASRHGPARVTFHASGRHVLVHGRRAAAAGGGRYGAVFAQCAEAPYLRPLAVGWGDLGAGALLHADWWDETHVLLVRADGTVELRAAGDLDRVAASASLLQCGAESVLARATATRCLTPVTDSRTAGKGYLAVVFSDGTVASLVVRVTPPAAAALGEKRARPEDCMTLSWTTKTFSLSGAVATDMSLFLTDSWCLCLVLADGGLAFLDLLTMDLLLARGSGAKSSSDPQRTAFCHVCPRPLSFLAVGGNSVTQLKAN